MKKTYREALHRASSLIQGTLEPKENKLAQKAQTNPQIAHWLLQHLLQADTGTVLAKLDEPMPEAEGRLYRSWVKRVLQGEPYQYVIGEEDFLGRSFRVTPDVLIPRPETESLVQSVVHQLRAWKQSDLLPKKDRVEAAQNMTQNMLPLTGVDVGCGSGIIAISLLLEWQTPPPLHMIGVDISERALHVARDNASRWQVDMPFRLSDGLQYLIRKGQKVDFIVSNPPYVDEAEQDQLDHTVIRYEPHQALFAEDQGLSIFRKVIEQSKYVLRRKAFIAFEVGLGQAEHVQRMIEQVYPASLCEVHQDLRGVERIIVARVENG